MSPNERRPNATYVPLACIGSRVGCGRVGVGCGKVNVWCRKVGVGSAT